MKKQIILDTNILLHSLQYKIDIEAELKRILPFNFEICILENTITELEFLKQKDPKAKFLAKLAKHLIKNFKIIKNQEKVDDTLIKLANENTIIATQDKEVKKQIKTPIIIIRSKTHLELKNYSNY